MTNLTKRFLIVDDDPVNNFLSKLELKKSLGEVDVLAFESPAVALIYIETEFEQQQAKEKITLLLDLNMPVISGWEFLDKFESFPETIKNQFDIYIVSSSIDPVDIERAKANPLVIDFVEKPLNKYFVVNRFLEESNSSYK